VYPPKIGTDRITIFDLLQAAKVSWRVYAVGPKPSTLEAFVIYTSHPEGVVTASQFFKGDFTFTGFRVPLIVISPFSKAPTCPTCRWITPRF
jgi:phospholipase C